MRDESERDERVMALVEAALDQPSDTRSEFVHSACGADAELCSEVLERVWFEDRMGNFLRGSVLDALELAERPFETGELVAGRFRILNEVGRGGMGVVYEAFDEKLNLRVAIKCAQSGYDNRLPPETRAAREVSHPNVCKVHDLHSVKTPLGEVEFVSMAFIEGETLSARIRRGGPLPAEEARGIALQICEGLAQAHRQGVIHGDLKCGNIILTTAPDGNRRAVITDFGLATMKLPESSDSTPDQVGGSFDYMAPELFSGSAVSVSSDVYALGVVFHVMLTGKPPSPGNKADPGEMGATLTLWRVDAGPVVGGRRDKLSAPWHRLVARCLKPAPEDRFASVDGIINRLERRDRSRKWLAAAPAAAAVLALTFWPGREQPGPTVRLAVLPIAVEGAPLPTAAGLGLELADRLSGARRGFVVISPVELQRNRVDTSDRAKSVFSATHVLRTRLRNSQAQMVVEASVVEAGSGQAVGELKGVYKANDLATVAKALTATITGAFRLHTGVPLEVVAGAAYPSYIQGLTLLKRDDVSADEAIPFLQKAAELDPRSALPLAYLGEAQLQKFVRDYGREWLDRAAQSVAKAESLNPDAAPVLVAAGWLKQQHGLYEQAVADLSRALELAPNNADAWNHLAGVYTSLNRPNEVIATYERAIQAQPDYYAPYIELGLFYHYNLGQFQEAEKIFRRVTVIAPGLARGHMDLGLALKEQGRFEEAEQSLLTALHLLESAQVLTNLGAFYYQEERYGEAAWYFEKSLSGNQQTALRFANLGDAYRRLGRAEDAERTYRQAAAMAHAEIIGNPKEPFSRSLLARVSALLGERSEAEFEIMQALNLGAGNTRVLRDAVLTFETLKERDKTLQVLFNAPRRLLEQLSREPEVRDLSIDPKFQELLTNKIAQ